QRVRERIRWHGAAADLDDQVCGERFLDRREQRVVVEADHSTEHCELELPAERGGVAEDAVGALRETCQPTAKYLADALRNPDLRDRGGPHPAPFTPGECTSLDEVAHDLLDEERV